jgi:DNA mismatch repair protein MutL
MLIYELIKILDTPESTIDVRRSELAMTVARSVSRRMPAIVSQEEATSLLNRLAESKNISFTPSGKNIMAEISLEELRAKLG